MIRLDSIRGKFFRRGASDDFKYNIPVSFAMTKMRQQIMSFAAAHSLKVSGTW
jgi:hypothetical protein